MATASARPTSSPFPAHLAPIHHSSSGSISGSYTPQHHRQGGEAKGSNMTSHMHGYYPGMPHPSMGIRITSTNGPSPSSSATSPSNPSALTQAKIKSSAAKRASAKAAAAAKKAAAGGATHDRETTNTSLTTSASSSSRSKTIMKDENDSNDGTPSPASPSDSKDEFVVPQRAKPGRKPSRDEPLTKRQAQNRASQRAFRERKQNHVSTLEDKVAAYEAEKLARDVKDQQAKKKWEQERAALKSQNEELKKKVRDLELALEQSRMNSHVTPYGGPPMQHHLQHGGWVPCYEAGCRAPLHEGAVASGIQPPPPPPPHVDSLNQQAGTKRSLPLAEDISRTAPPPTANDFASTTQMRAIPIPASSPDLSATIPHRGSIWDTNETPFFLVSQKRQQPHRRSSLLSPPLGLPGVPDEPSNRDVLMDGGDCGFCTDATPCLCRGDTLVDLTGMDEEMSITVTTRPPADQSISSGTWLEGVGMMGKIEEEDEDFAFDDDDQDDQAGGKGQSPRKNNTSSAALGSAPVLASAINLPRRPAAVISSLLSARSKASPSRPKLWSITSLPKVASVSALGSATQAGPMSSSAAAPQAPVVSDKDMKKLWWTRPATAQTYNLGSLTTFVPSPSAVAGADRSAVFGAASSSYAKAPTIAAGLCSGDPANCPACGTDPALAAFCEAVGEDEEARSQVSSVSTIGPSASQRGSIGARSEDGEAGERMDVELASSSKAASAAAAHPNTQPHHPSYSIPDAFQQIRSHPAFPHWQGGLNLLADVARGRSGREGGSHSPLPPPPVHLEEERPGMKHSASFADAPAVSSTGVSERPRLLKSSTTSITSPPIHPHLPSVRSSHATAADPSIDTNGDASSHSLGGNRPQKRRRLYLENERVEEVLRLLDRGMISGHHHSAAQSSSGATMSTGFGMLPPLPPPQALGVGHGAGMGQRFDLIRSTATTTTTPTSTMPMSMPVSIPAFSRRISTSSTRGQGIDGAVTAVEEEEEGSRGSGGGGGERGACPCPWAKGSMTTTTTTMAGFKSPTDGVMGSRQR